MHVIDLIMFISHSFPSTSPKHVHTHICLPPPNFRFLIFLKCPNMFYKYCQHGHGCGPIYGSIGNLHVTAPSNNNSFPFL